MSLYENYQKELRANPKKWVITGVAGFIGSNLLEALLKLDQEVVGLDNFATGSQKNLDEIKSLVTTEQWKKFTFIEGDIRNFETCKVICDGADKILHQAALGSVPRSINDPRMTNEVNISGFVNMLRAAQELSVDRFVYAASSSTYGDSTVLPKIENVIGKPLSPYAVTKYVNELYADVFNKIYGLDTIGLRYFNVFGRRQDPHGAYAAVIPNFVIRFMKYESPIINGDGTFSRDFTYIDNVIQMNILAAMVEQSQAINEVYNTAVGGRTDITKMAELLRELLSNYDNNISNVDILYGEKRAGDIPHSLASIEKAKKMLGYNPTHTFEEGLQKAVDWYWYNLK